MIRYENDCVGPCPQGCINCGRKHVPHFYCDTCGCEIDYDDIHEDGEGHICMDCILDKYPKVNL